MIYDLIIIGGGPAGMTAGIYAARQKLNTLLITKSFGGQLARKSVAIENYPGFEKISGLELLQKFEKHLRSQKIKIETDETVKIEKKGSGFLVLTKNNNKFEAKSVIVASGADPRPLKVPGEKEFIGKGVSYCTACDGPLFSKKTVAVIGGGNSGFESAIFLTNYAKKIYILERGSEVKAEKENQDSAKSSGKVEVITDAVLKEIKGKKFVDSLVYQDSKSNETKTLKVEGILVEIGSVPAVSMVEGLVDFDKLDHIKIDPKTCATKTPGLFAAGDVTDIRDKQIVVAAGEGTKAVFSVYRYLRSQ
jgi:thioredoxin-disulfide reductase